MRLDYMTALIQGKLVYVMEFLERRQARDGGQVVDPNGLMHALDIVLYPEYVVRYDPPFWTFCKFRSVKNWREPGFLDSDEIFRGRNIFELIEILRADLQRSCPTLEQQELVGTMYYAVQIAVKEWIEWRVLPENEGAPQMDMLERLVAKHSRQLWSEHYGDRLYV